MSDQADEPPADAAAEPESAAPAAEADEPKAEEPKAEEPKAEEPKADEPKPEAEDEKPEEAAAAAGEDQPASPKEGSEGGAAGESPEGTAADGGSEGTSVPKSGSKQSLKSSDTKEHHETPSALDVIAEEGSEMHGGMYELGEEEEGEVCYTFNEPVERRVLCVGQCHMGFILYCNKYTPENTEQKANESTWQRSGNAANVSTTLRLLETPAEFFGVLSKYEAFECIVEDFRERGIYIHHCPKSPLQPSIEQIVVSHQTGSHTTVRCKSSMPHITFEQFKALGDLSQFLWFHFEGYNVEETMKMMKYVRSFNESLETKIKVSLSLEIHSREVLKLAQYADYNIMGSQLARYLGWNEPEIACRKLRAYLEKNEAETCWPSVIIVPWAEQGACFMDVDDSLYMMPAYAPIAINDTVGLGDIFIGAFIQAILVENRVTRDAVDFANYVCSFKLAHLGFDVIRDVPKDKALG